MCIFKDEIIQTKIDFKFIDTSVGVRVYWKNKIMKRNLIITINNTGVHTIFFNNYNFKHLAQENVIYKCS